MEDTYERVLRSFQPKLMAKCEVTEPKLLKRAKIVQKMVYARILRQKSKIFVFS